MQAAREDEADARRGWYRLVAPPKSPSGGGETLRVAYEEQEVEMAGLR